MSHALSSRRGNAKAFFWLRQSLGVRGADPDEFAIVGGNKDLGVLPLLGLDLAAEILKDTNGIGDISLAAHR